MLPEICTTVNILFLKKFTKLRQPTSGLAVECSVQFLPYMGLNNKNLLYYTTLSFHKQQNNSKQLTPFVYTGYESGLH